MYRRRHQKCRIAFESYSAYERHHGRGRSHCIGGMNHAKFSTTAGRFRSADPTSRCSGEGGNSLQIAPISIRQRHSGHK